MCNWTDFLSPQMKKTSGIIKKLHHFHVALQSWNEMTQLLHHLNGTSEHVGYAIRKVMTVDHVLVFSLHQLEIRHFSVIFVHTHMHAWWNTPGTITFPGQLIDCHIAA